MITKLVIPKVDANVEEQTITAWLKHEGDAVLEGEPVVEITTSKACYDLESPCTGMLRTVLAKEKSVLPIGYVIALVGEPDDMLPDVADENKKLMEQYRLAAGKGKPTIKADAAQKGRQAPPVKATPAARRLARERGVDLVELSQRMHGALITETMVNEAAETAG